MIIAALIGFALQAAPPTVGDTVWLSVRVPVASRQILRPQAWDLGELGQVLGPPEIRYDADSATIRYPVVFWFPGNHPVSVPGPIVVSPEGRSDTLAARPLVAAVRSVLPAGARRDSLAPKRAAELVGQAQQSWLPLGIAGLLLLLTGGIAAAWLVRRRRPVTVPQPTVPAPADPVARLYRWAEAGETRAVLEGWSQLIEARLALSTDPADRAAVEPLLLAIGAVGFRPDTPPTDVDRLIGSARRWVAEGR